MSAEINSFVRVLREKIREDMNNYADDVATGVCQNYESYKHLTGIIQGLAMAERHILDLMEKVEKDDE
jgi:metal-dependent amidase/aminoacylase/carboxypeptidase family protein